MKTPTNNLVVSALSNVMTDRTANAHFSDNLFKNIAARSQAWRTGPRLAAAFFLGLLAALAMPPIHAFPVLVLAFAGLLLLIEPLKTWKQGLALGWVFGFGFFAASLYWITEAFLVDIDRFGWMAPFALIGGAGALAIETAIAVAIYTQLRPQGWLRVPVFASLWTLSEVWRGWMFTGFPWNLMGATWAAWDTPIQLASVVGVFGLTWLTVFAASAPIILIDGHSSRRRHFSIAALVVIIPVGLIGFGVFRLSQGDITATETNLRLVQPNILQSEKWQPHLRAGHVDKQVRMSLGSTGEGPAKPPPNAALVIWAETAVPFALPWQSDVVAALRQAIPKSGKLIVGAPRPVQMAGQQRQAYNSAFVFDFEGRLETVYDKHHLVPFGEYLPFRHIAQALGIEKLAQGLGDFSSGPGPQTLNLEGYPDVAILICYEIIFPDDVVMAASRPQWILNMTNDAWFGSSAGPYQHFIAAKLRAIEQGLPVVRVANGGISAVINPKGQEMARLELGDDDIIDVTLPAALGPTQFSHYGSLPVIIFSVLVLLFGLFRHFKSAIN